MEVGCLYLNQVLVHPFREGLFLYSISFIYKKKKNRQKDKIHGWKKKTQLHVRTVLLILGGCHLFSIDKIRKDTIVQRYIPEQRCQITAWLTQTVQFPNKKQQDLDNAHTHWDKSPACPHPVLWVLDSNRNHKVCHLSWIQEMKRAFQFKFAMLWWQLWLWQWMKLKAIVPLFYIVWTMDANTTSSELSV